MERKEYVELCQMASIKTYFSGAWWRTHWNLEELVSWNGGKYVPVDYRFGFLKGKPQHLAIIHDLKANTEYTVKLEEIENAKENNHVPDSKTQLPDDELPNPSPQLRDGEAGADGETYDGQGV